MVKRPSIASASPSRSPKLQKTHDGPQPGTDGSPTGPQPGADACPPGIETVELVNHADPAQQYRVSEHPARIQLEKLGFHPQNRGGQGMIPHHAHQVAYNIMDKGTIIRRYNFVRAVIVPAKEREKWLTANRNKFDQEPLCPRATDEMCFALLTRTHFTSAQKLVKEGNRNLYNENAKPIRLKKDDDEGHLIQRDGVLCVLYGEDLWYNTAALQALMAEDNDDASIVLAEDEVSALGRVDATIRSLAARPNARLTMESVLDEMKNHKANRLPAANLMHLIRFRMGIPSSCAKIFTDCVFNKSQGRVTVNTENYDRIAQIKTNDWHWIKICLMVYLYTQSSQVESLLPTLDKSSTNKVEVICYKKDIYQAIGQETELADRVTNFIKMALERYKQPKTEDGSQLREYRKDLLVKARGELLGKCGRALFKVGQKIASDAMSGICLLLRSVGSL